MEKFGTMTRKKYMAVFSRSARWRLGGAEAEEAISDYRELVYQEERDEAKLVEELGDPVQAVWLLTDVREYKRWQKVLAVLVCCALFCAEWAFDGLPFYWRVRSNTPELWKVFLQFLLPAAAAAVLTICWFRRREEKSGPLTWRLLLALAGMGLAGGAVLLQVWRSFDMTWYIWSENGHGYASPEFAAVEELVIDLGFLAPLAGLAGLLLARCRNRRWAGVFILGLTLSVLCLMAQHGLRETYGGDRAAMEMIRRELFQWLVPVGVVGVIGTGAALC